MYKTLATALAVCLAVSCPVPHVFAARNCPADRAYCSVYDYSTTTYGDDGSRYTTYSNGYGTTTYGDDGSRYMTYSDCGEPYRPFVQAPCAAEPEDPEDPLDYLFPCCVGY
ncbi:MAG: hypothetical protein MR209_04360 [Veillonellaceae bacterium]|nr:hypothetical protein [Veillonellaceae bacterium]